MKKIFIICLFLSAKSFSQTSGWYAIGDTSLYYLNSLGDTLYGTSKAYNWKVLNTTGLPSGNFNGGWVNVVGTGYPNSGLTIKSTGSGAAYTHYESPNATVFDFGKLDGEVYMYSNANVPINFYNGGLTKRFIINGDGTVNVGSYATTGGSRFSVGDAAQFQVNSSGAVVSGTWSGSNLSQSQITNLTTDLAAKQATLVSNTNIKTINGASVLGSGDIAVSGTSTATFLNLASNFASTSTTEAAVTGWSFAVTTGKTYRIEVIAAHQTAATTTGGELGFFLTASGAGTIRGFAEADIVSTAAASGLKQPITAIGAADAAGSNLISTGVTAINSPHSFYAIVTFTCTVSGTFNVGWATEVNASSAQLNAGSSLIYQVLN